MMDLDLLDKLAAEKIMGWHARHTSWNEVRTEMSGGEAKLYPDWFLMPHENWQPTRNISQAFELLEKIEGSKHVTYNHLHKKWYCSLWATSNTEECDTAPLAITIACLKAKGVKID